MITSAGKDQAASAIANTSTQAAAANYIALTANATAPSAGDTTLTAEIATGGGGLIRAQAAYSHTTGQSTFTLSKTFTANGSDSLPVTVAKIGVFNASSSGSLCYETLLGTTATISASGDAVTVSDVFTLS